MWQHLQHTQTNVYLYSAHLDVRSANSRTSIRVIAAIESSSKRSLNLYCHVWISGKKSSLVVEASNFRAIGWSKLEDEDEGVVPINYLFECTFDKNSTKATKIRAVTISTSECESAPNALAIHYFKPTTKRKFAVCVKALEMPFNDLSTRLVEWIEAVKLLGAEKVFVYHMHIHENISKVFNYYKAASFLDVRRLPLPGGQPTSALHEHVFVSGRVKSHIRHEKVAQHDCFYRNIYNYRYVVVIDTDELIWPRWDDIVSELEAQKGRRRIKHAGGLEFPHVYMFEGEKESKLPKDFPILRRVRRSFHSLGHQMKSFVATRRVIQLTTHRPIRCLGGDCGQIKVEKGRGFLFHYRDAGCVKDITLSECRSLTSQKTYEGTIADNATLYTTLLKNVRSALKKLNLNVS